MSIQATVSNPQVTESACCAAADASAKYRISTHNLDIADSVIKVAAGYVAYTNAPEAALSGALIGAFTRLLVGDAKVVRDEDDVRASRVASLSFSTLSAVSIHQAATQSSILPLVIGFFASSDGVYCLLRRVVG